MKQLPLIAAGVASAIVAAVGCGHVVDRIDKLSSDATAANGPSKTETRNITSFHKVKVSSAIQVRFQSSATPSLSIQGPADALKWVKSKVSGDTLELAVDHSLTISSPIIVTLTGPSPSKIDLDGASSFEGKGIDSAQLEVGVGGASHLGLIGKIGELVANADGASNLDLREVSARSVKLGLEGASEGKISGTTATLNVKADGASTADILTLKAQEVTASADGASHIQVASAAKLDAKADGASTIEYRGDPRVVVKKSEGVSSINKL